MDPGNVADPDIAGPRCEFESRPLVTPVPDEPRGTILMSASRLSPVRNLTACVPAFQPIANQHPAN